MLIYGIVLSLVAIYGIYPYKKHNSRQSKKIFLILSFSTMALVLGLRGKTVGEDTGHYLEIFKYSANVKWTDLFHSVGMRTGYYTNQYGYTDTIEDGFLVLAKTVHFFTDNGHVFLFIVAAITCALFAKFIYDNCPKVFFATLIFLCESMFMFAFNGARQILAVAIVMQAYTLLKKNKWKKAVVIIIIATLIHNVALVGIVLLPITFIKPKKEFKAFKYAIIVAVASPFVIVLSQSIIIKFFPRYRAYFTTNYWGNSLGGTAILWFIEFLLVLIAYRRKFTYKKKLKTENSFKTACLILIYIACELMGLRITMFSRVGWFFRSYLILFLPECEYYFSKKVWMIIKTILVILLLLLYYSYASSPSRNYSFCF